MFTVYHSNELDVLVGLCINLMQRARSLSHDPLAVQSFVVQRPEIFTYLKQRIALETGIATRLESRTIWKLVWDVGRAVVPNFPENSPFDKKPLTLIILSIFEHEDFLRDLGEGALATDPGFSDIINYINGRSDNDDLIDLSAMCQDFDTLESNAKKNIVYGGLHLPFIDNLKNDYAKRRFELALRLADVYESYQIYRPDWILAWKKGDTLSWLGKNVDENTVKNCHWVARLWHEYVLKNCARGEEEWDRATAVASIIEVLNKPDRQIKNKLEAEFPNDIYVFGASSLPPSAFDVLLALGRHLNVHFMLCNPSREYWGDLSSNLDCNKLRRIISKQVNVKDISEACTSLAQCHEVEHYAQLTDTCFDEQLENIIAHPLLLSLGRQGRDMLSVLTEKMYSLADNEYVNEIFAFVPCNKEDEVEASSLLARLQQDILNARVSTDDGGRYVIDSNDQSIRITGCAGKLREVQELYDVVMAKFMADETLTPRDMVVMIPSLKDYVPYIKAVFEANNSFVTKLRYRICDRSLKEENPCLQAVSRMMRLNDTPLTSAELLEFIGVKQIAEQYGIETSDIQLIKKFISNGHMVAGLNFDDLNLTDEQLSLDIKFSFTISSGLERELFGSLMPKLESDDSVPYLTAIDSHGTEILGHLGCFIADLVKLRTELNFLAEQQYHGLEGEEVWRKFVQSSILYQFFKFEDGEQDVMRTVALAFSTLREQVQHSKNPPLVTIALIRSLIDEAAKGQSEFSHFLDGSLNFCTFVPMRSIPFKHIFMIGLNDGEFPRSVDRLSFDPMELEFRKGDRSRRDDDRYMFMEGLGAAQESLYISYCARNPQDGTELNPSVVVNEICDYIVSTSVMSSDLRQGVDVIEDNVRSHIIRYASLNVFDDANFMNGASNSRDTPSCQVFWRGINVFEPTVPSSTTSLNAPISQITQTDNTLKDVQADVPYALGNERSTPRGRTQTIELSRSCHRLAPPKCLGLTGFMSALIEPLENGVINIDVSDLERFFTGPQQFFCQNVLGLFKAQDYKIDNHESFTVENLVQYRILNNMVTMHADEFECFINNEAIKGNLPAYELGTEYKSYYLKRYQAEFVNKLRDNFLGKNLTSQIDLRIDLQESGDILTVLIKELYPNFDKLSVHLTGMVSNVCQELDSTIKCTNFWRGENHPLAHFAFGVLKFLLLSLRNESVAPKVEVYHRDLIKGDEKKQKEKKIFIFNAQTQDLNKLNVALARMLMLYLIGRVWPLPLMIKSCTLDLMDSTRKNVKPGNLLSDNYVAAWENFKNEFISNVVGGNSANDFVYPDEYGAMLFGDGNLYLDTYDKTLDLANSNDIARCQELLRASFMEIRKWGEILRP